MNENNLKNKKSNNVIIVILSILLTLSITYIVYDIINEKNMFSNGDNQSTENNNVLPQEKEEVKQLSLENELVKELYERTQYGFFGCGGEPYFLKYNIKVNDQLLAENLSDSDKLNLVTENIELPVREDSETSKAYLSEEQIESALKQVFGENYKFDKTKTTENISCGQFGYNSGRYEANWFCGGTGPCGPTGKHVLTEIYKAQQGNDYIDIYQVLAYDAVLELYEPNHELRTELYKDKERKELVVNRFEDSESLSKYVEQLPQYKYSFKKDSAGNYYFYSIERVN